MYSKSDSMAKLGKTCSALLAYRRISPDSYGENEGRRRARRGLVPVLVGRDIDAMERLHVPTKLVQHPYIAALLDMSADEFGYGQQGLIRIQFDADSFRQMVKKISKEKRLVSRFVTSNHS